jgi:hypothetical protein
VIDGGAGDGSDGRLSVVFVTHPSEDGSHPTKGR